MKASPNRRNRSGSGAGNRYGDYGSGAQTDPLGAASGADRVFRGGSWSNGGRGLRSVYRFNITPSLRDYGIGFRLVHP
ncbi:MAG: hypothetical protein LBT14_02265 [Treponema sp.]|nr:hypothetical protein [Treponema sp.]